MTDPKDDLANLIDRLSHPVTQASNRPLPRPPVPIYILNVDEPDPLAIVLQIRTGDDGVARAKIILPRWQELPAGWDGPHKMEVAIPLANDYAHEYGYHAIAVDIESSQLWDALWGTLERHRDLD